MWVSVDQCGSVWVCIYGLIWLGVGHFGSVWVSVGGCIWSNMAWCRSIWVWVSVGQGGSVWISVGQCGSVWVSVGGIGIGIGFYSIINYGGSKGLKNMTMVGPIKYGTQI